MEDATIEAVALPNMNVSQPQMIPMEMRAELEPAKAENIAKISEEILSDINKSGDKIDELLENFVNMVMNEGDASSSSKEAVVNLIKTKTDLADKKIKVMELYMRAFLKESNTFPKYLAATQNNKITIQSGMRDIIKSVKKEQNEQE
jgi:hypothetical protein